MCSGWSTDRLLLSFIIMTAMIPCRVPAGTPWSRPKQTSPVLYWLGGLLATSETCSNPQTVTKNFPQCLERSGELLSQTRISWKARSFLKKIEEVEEALEASTWTWSGKPSESSQGGLCVHARTHTRARTHTHTRPRTHTHAHKHTRRQAIRVEAGSARRAWHPSRFPCTA